MPRQQSLRADHWSNHRRRDSSFRRDSVRGRGSGTRVRVSYSYYTYWHDSCLPIDRKTRARRLSIHLVVGMVLLALLNLWFYLEHKENISLSCVILLVITVGFAPCLLWQYHEDKSLRQLPTVARAQLFTVCLFELAAIIGITSLLGILVPYYKDRAESDPANFSSDPFVDGRMPDDEKGLFFAMAGLFAGLLPTLVVLMAKLGDISEQAPDAAPERGARALADWQELVTRELRDSIACVKRITALAWILCAATTGVAFACYFVTDKIPYLLYTLASLLATSSAATVVCHRMKGTKLAVPGKAIQATRDVIVATQSQIFVQAVTCVSLLGRAMGTSFWGFLFDELSGVDLLKSFLVAAVLLYMLLAVVKLQLTYEELTDYFSGSEMITALQKQRLTGQGQGGSGVPAPPPQEREIVVTVPHAERPVPAVAVGAEPSAPVKDVSK
jgi:uncharacterized membrane protein